MRIKLDLLKPNMRSHVLQQQLRQQHYAPGTRCRSFDIGEVVMAKDYMQKKWIKGEVVRQESPVTYIIHTTDGRDWKRQVEQITGCDLPLHSERSSTELNSSEENVLFLLWVIEAILRRLSFKRIPSRPTLVRMRNYPTQI